jgi:DNA mismatch repair ATPase MutS
MSGKSTLLRAVGANAVLALAGAPVRATKLTLTPVALGATIRVQDSLRDGRSRFFAEVTRVRAVLDRAAKAPPVLFLFDELFAGTNSADRLVGAEAVLRTLLDAGAVGLVTTHDLALTAAADRLGGRAANVHFADHTAADGAMTFDYTMRPGVVPHGNGVALMRAVGLKV